MQTRPPNRRVIFCLPRRERQSIREKVFAVENLHGRDQSQRLERRVVVAGQGRVQEGARAQEPDPTRWPVQLGPLPQPEPLCYLPPPAARPTAVPMRRDAWASLRQAGQAHALRRDCPGRLLVPPPELWGDRVGGEVGSLSGLLTGVPLPVSWTREGDITTAPPPSNGSLAITAAATSHPARRSTSSRRTFTAAPS